MRDRPGFEIEPGSAVSSCGFLGGGAADVLSPRTLWSFADGELDAVTLAQVVEPLAVHGALVEEVFLPRAVLDDTESVVYS
jgi:hypothetical protein